MTNYLREVISHLAGHSNEGLALLEGVAVFGITFMGRKKNQRGK